DPDVRDAPLWSLNENALLDARDVAWVEARLELNGQGIDQPGMNALPQYRMFQIRVHPRKRHLHRRSPRYAVCWPCAAYYTRDLPLQIRSGPPGARRTRLRAGKEL